MKQERTSRQIAEAIYKCTEAYVKDQAIERITAFIETEAKDFGSRQPKARVQLLAKVLYWVEAWFVEDADITQGISRRDAAQRVRDALKEAGLEG